jgi:hypothetical protein
MIKDLYSFRIYYVIILRSVLKIKNTLTPSYMGRRHKTSAVPPVFPQNAGTLFSVTGEARSALEHRKLQSERLAAHQ